MDDGMLITGNEQTDGHGFNTTCVTYLPARLLALDVDLPSIGPYYTEIPRLVPDCVMASDLPV
jgi:hypothetical protein